MIHSFFVRQQVTSLSWIILTFCAVILQTFRNAFQSKLSQQGVTTAGVTLSRFLLAPPIAGAYLFGLYQWQDTAIPTFSLSYWLYVMGAAFLQIAATSLMVILFKQRNFAVGAGLAKSEALVAGALGSLFFGSELTLAGWFGIGIGAVAVFVLSGARQKGTLSLKVVLIGLACGTCFALTSLFVREASLTLNVGFPYNAAWVLLTVLCIQTMCLTGYVAVTQKQALTALWQSRTLLVATSTCSCLGSIAWFGAMALQYVAYVKTLGQTEVLFTIVIATVWLKQKVTQDEVIGLLLIAIAAIFVMWQ